MAQRDPAIQEAQQLWQRGERREAMMVLVYRIEELSEMVYDRPAQRRDAPIVAGPRQWLRAVIAVALIILLIALVLVAKGMLNDMQTF